MIQIEAVWGGREEGSYKYDSNFEPFKKKSFFFPQGVSMSVSYLWNFFLIFFEKVLNPSSELWGITDLKKRSIFIICNQ